MKTRTTKLALLQKREHAELLSIVRLLDLFPEGILSYVSDTYDLWAVCSNILPKIKDKIMARNGKLVIRPDSGDPIDIICGELHAIEKPDQRGMHDDRNLKSAANGKDVHAGIYNEKYYVHCRYDHRCTSNDEMDPRSISPKDKGVVELLWDCFGGTVNEKGYKVLDPHIGVIYGDSITLERANEICARLEAKGFASTNVVLGIGSYTYNYNTRDTLGIAVKSTYCEVGGEEREIFKDPITDDGLKKSAKGLLRVDEVDGVLTLKDQCTKEEEAGGLLETTFLDGKLVRETTLSEIRARLAENKE